MERWDEKSGQTKVFPMTFFGEPSKPTQKIISPKKFRFSHFSTDVSKKKFSLKKYKSSTLLYLIQIPTVARLLSVDFGCSCQGSFETRAAARFAEAFQGFSAGQELGELLATSFLKARKGEGGDVSPFFLGEEKKTGKQFPVFFFGGGEGGMWEKDVCVLVMFAMLFAFGVLLC